MDAIDSIVEQLVQAERKRQDEKRGQQTHTYTQWKSIFEEEFAELHCKVVCDYPQKEQKRELVQCAAVLYAWIRDVILKEVG